MMNEQTEKEKKDKATEEEINEELKQTFPASDPPSVSRPGHDREKDEEEKAGDK